MRALLALAAFSLAAVALPAAPAQAGDRDDPRSGFVSGGSGFVGEFGRHDRRHVRGTDTVLVYDRGYQGDSAWRAESFNDWWHERTERSYPRWMQNNVGCARKWWGGDTLRC
jgi:hypothetical protein